MWKEAQRLNRKIEQQRMKEARKVEAMKHATRHYIIFVAPRKEGKRSE